ncbi:MAG: DUF445 domain-containing protein [Alphaproteobacteria bacterium]|nr:DUF445 domain-containing protein [Alphaproteobacteria bacterium]
MSLSLQTANIAKRRALARRRLVASGLLLLAAAVFVAMQLLPSSFGVRLADAASEAALVGGLADWFAVTAIFRRPLGLPIPHTALIPKRKDAIGEALGAFVRDRFLAPDLVVARLRQKSRALQIAEWLRSPTAASFVAERVAALLPVLLETSDSAATRQRIFDLIQKTLGRIDPAPVFTAAIDGLIASGRHVLLIDMGVELARSSLATLEPIFLENVASRTGRFFPAYFDRKIAEGLVSGLRHWLDAIATSSSRERAELEAWLRQSLRNLKHAPSYPTLLAELRLAIFENPALHTLATSALDELRRELEADLGAPEPRLPQLLARGTQRLGTALAESPELQGYFNGALERLVTDYIAPWRSAISQFIAEVVASWDTATIVDVIELEAGSDLQFVRINGTVVGALIGVLLFLVARTL